MGKMREVEIPAEPGKPSRTIQMTNLEWALQFVLLKVQELVSTFFANTSETDYVSQIFHNRKTDMCGVVLAGTDGDSDSPFVGPKTSDR